MHWYLTTQKNSLSAFLVGVFNTATVVLLFGTFVLIFSSTNTVIQASDVDVAIQEEEQVTQENPSLITDIIFESSELRDEIAEVKRSLNGQLTEYRQAEQNFNIMRGQFVQLNTLSSLESAVQATRNVMEKRATVLRTYLTLLRLESLNTTGVKLEYREYLISEINRLDTALIRHTDQARVSLDRDSITKTADDFEPLAEELQTFISLARQVLQLGRYQAVYDSTSSVIKSIQEQSEDPTSKNAILVTPQDERAYGQIVNRMSDVNETLTLADKEIFEEIKPDSRGRGVQIENSISSAYAEFRQVFRFLDELLQNYR